MNIIYFTTAQETNDFNEYRKIWNAPFNSSNQVFHNKLIRSLSLSNHVDVISIRPFSKDHCLIKRLDKSDRITSDIHWHYLKIQRNWIIRHISSFIQSKRIITSLPKDSIIITDTINPSILSIATIISSRRKNPVVGVCTDSPSNITGTSRSYTMYILRKSASLDGYITLTSSLNDLFNVKNKPYTVFEGLVEDKLPPIKNNKYKNYFFYSGALPEKYGIYDLLDAFEKLNNQNYTLLICGHHESVNFKERVRKNKHIKFLGQVSNKEVLQFEQDCIANINPRPFSEDLDRFSIPSKVIEYANSNRPTISTKCSKIQKIFQDEIIWTKTNNSDGILEAMERVIKMSDSDRSYITTKAKEQSQKHYSLTAINKKIIPFLEEIKSK